MNLGQLRTSDAVARSGSFSAAALSLRVTPAAVSLQVRLLFIQRATMPTIQALVALARGFGTQSRGRRAK